jgi:hypothetical protein
MTDRRSIGLLLALHLLVVVIVQPRGDFPVNDDWAYAHSVQWLLSEGRVRLSDWIAMNLLPQTLGGGLVAALFGFSFETLRHLTQLVAALTSIAAYFWFRAARFDPADALAATVAVMAFPAWPVLANSYMTDLYGMLFALPSAALFLQALQRPGRGTLIAATLLAVLGVLQRQVVLVIPVAFMVAWLWGNRRWTARTLLIGLAPVVTVIAAQVAYQAYLVHGPGLPEAQRFTQGRLVPMILKAFTNEDRHGEWVILNVITLLGYFGLFSVGWGLWWGWGGVSRKPRLAIAAGGIAIAAVALAAGWLPPYRMNMVLDAAGIGPFAIYDAFVRGTSIDRGPGILWRVAAIAGAFGAAALLALLYANASRLWRERRDTPPDVVFLLAVIGAYLFPFTAVDYIDRYLLFVLPFLFVLWARTWPASPAVTPSKPASAILKPGDKALRRGIAIAWILAAVGLSAVATRDYFAWNRARWDAIRAAEALGATPDTLDGGFEYNGFTRFERKPRELRPGKSAWWVKDDEYIVTFVPVAGYEEVRAFPVRRWLPRTPPVVRLLRRK